MSKAKNCKRRAAKGGKTVQPNSRHKPLSLRPWAGGPKDHTIFDLNTGKAKRLKREPLTKEQFRTRRARKLPPRSAILEPDWVAISARRVSQPRARPSREVFEVTLSDLNNEGAVTSVRAERSGNRREEVV
jgi:hypothetical protein